MDEIDQRILDCKTQITKFPFGIYKADCVTMFINVERLQNEISKEMVVCRRKQAPTIKFNELYASLNETVAMLEKHILFAVLSI